MANKKTQHSSNPAAEKKVWKAQNMQRSAAAVGPDIDTLKSKFKAKSVPLETDFATLIDIADCGRKAVGASPGQAGPGVGLTLDPAGKLAVQEPGLGLSFDKNNSLQVETGNGIAVDKDSGKVTVRLGAGLGLVEGKIEADAKSEFVYGMITIYYGSADDVPKDWVLCDGKDGITPDLTDRFILGASELGKESCSGKAVNGTYKLQTDEWKSKDIEVPFTVDGHAITVEEMPKHNHQTGPALTGANGTEPSDENLKVWAPYGAEKYNDFIAINVDDKNDHSLYYKNPKGCYISYTGPKLSTNSKENEADTHNHTGTATVNLKHTHDVTITTPYYAVAFIMYTGKKG